MTAPEYSDSELTKLAVLGEAVVANPANTPELIELAKKTSKEATPLMLGTLAVIRDVCINETGPSTRAEILNEALTLVHEDSIFRMVGVTLAWATECYLNRKNILSDEEQELSDQIAFWRETEVALTLSRVED